MGPIRSMLKLASVCVATLFLTTALAAQDHNPNTPQNSDSTTLLSAALPPQDTSQTPAPPPPAVKEIERDIEHEVHRWRLGLRGGIALDPELISFGVQSRIGPIFSRKLTFR